LLRATPSKIDIEFTAGSQKPGLMGENTSLQPLDTAKNPVMKVDINSASIGIVKSNQQSILNYHSVFRVTVNSQHSTVNNNSGATGIDMTPGEGGLINIFDANDISQPAPRPKTYSASSKCSATAW